MKVFANTRKIDAILGFVDQLHNLGFQVLKNNIVKKGIEYIQHFPFMGPATSYHFAKNIGLDVVKPDRHLVRIASKAGYICPDQFCDTISKIVGDKKAVVDVVMWRFAALESNYLEYFTSHGRVSFKDRLIIGSNLNN